MNESQVMQSDAEKNEIPLLNIARLLLSKFYWLLLAGIVAAVSVYFAVSLLVTPTYKSRVSFYVYNSASNTTHTGTINNSDLQAAESLATTYSKILGSNSILDKVLADVNADSCLLSRKELSNMTEVSVIADTQLLEVVVTSDDPKFACKVAGSFATVAPAEIVRITKAGGVEVVDRPEVPTEQSSPRPLRNAVIGFVGGVVVVAVIILLQTLSDTTLYLPEDIEKMTGAAVLGQIPDINVTDENFTYWSLTEGGAVSDAQVRTQDKQSKGNA